MHRKSKYVEANPEPFVVAAWNIAIVAAVAAATATVAYAAAVVGTVVVVVVVVAAVLIGMYVVAAGDARDRAEPEALTLSGAACRQQLHSANFDYFLSYPLA